MSGPHTRTSQRVPLIRTSQGCLKRTSMSALLLYVRGTHRATYKAPLRVVVVVLVLVVVVVVVAVVVPVAIVVVVVVVVVVAVVVVVLLRLLPVVVVVGR